MHNFYLCSFIIFYIILKVHILHINFYLNIYFVTYHNFTCFNLYIWYAFIEILPQFLDIKSSF